MSEPDDRIARRYRELPREEPRAAIDDAILAASRRAVARPSASRRWAAPVSIAAVLVLALGITLEMQREEPGVATSFPSRAQPAPERAAEPAAPPAASSAPADTIVQPRAPTVAKRAPAAAPKRVEPSREGPIVTPMRVAPPPSAPAPEKPASEERAALPAPFPAATDSANAAASGANVAAPAARAPSRMKVESADAMERSVAAPSAQAQDAEAVRELDRIAKLRDEGRAAEADAALDRFRRDHPAYRIPDATWARVRPR